MANQKLFGPAVTAGTGTDVPLDLAKESSQPYLAIAVALYDGILSKKKFPLELFTKLYAPFKEQTLNAGLVTPVERLYSACSKLGMPKFISMLSDSLAAIAQKTVADQPKHYHLRTKEANDAEHLDAKLTIAALAEALNLRIELFEKADPESLPKHIAYSQTSSPSIQIELVNGQYKPAVKHPEPFMALMDQSRMAIPIRLESNNTVDFIEEEENFRHVLRLLQEAYVEKPMSIDELKAIYIQNFGRGQAKFAGTETGTQDIFKSLLDTRFKSLRGEEHLAHKLMEGIAAQVVNGQVSEDALHARIEARASSVMRF